MNGMHHGKKICFLEGSKRGFANRCIYLDNEFLSSSDEEQRKTEALVKNKAGDRQQQDKQNKQDGNQVGMGDVLDPGLSSAAMRRGTS